MKKNLNSTFWKFENGLQGVIYFDDNNMLLFHYKCFDSLWNAINGIGKTMPHPFHSAVCLCSIVVLGCLDIQQDRFTWCHFSPDSKLRGANMGPTWVLAAPDGPHVALMNLTIREGFLILICSISCEAAAPHPLLIHNIGSLHALAPGRFEWNFKYHVDISWEIEVA